MISRIGRSLPSFLVGAHVAGEGVQERLRSATFALLGLVTATGLVLVGISYNQGWPDFVDSPIPGIQTERVGEASIVAGAVHATAHPGKPLSESVPTAPRSAPAGESDDVRGGSSAPKVSSQQLAPVTVPGGHVPAPSGQSGDDAPASPVPAPVASAPQAAAQPPPAASTSPDPQTTKEPTPVATSPPASKGAATVPGNGKAKGHEKKSTAPAPVVPKAPSVPAETPAPKAPPTPPAPTVPPKEAPPPASEQPGKGLAKGHYK